MYCFEICTGTDVVIVGKEYGHLHLCERISYDNMRAVLFHNRFGFSVGAVRSGRYYGYCSIQKR